MILHTVKKTMIVAALATLALPQVASADRDFAGIYTECGLGAMIAPKSDAVAAVTNVTWDLGTTAILSNLSSPESCKGGKAKVAAFINDSYNKIEKDLASGDGKYLRTLASLATPAGESKDAFIASLRKDFALVVASNDYSSATNYQKAEKLYNIVY